MQTAMRSNRLNLILAGSAGAIFGGVIVLIAGRVIPRMMSRVMSDVMQNMMKRMGGDCSPSEF